ncbi:polymorphic toxin-type HINT domain-containing protein [Mycolicibacterium mucogenicum]|nr:polymorphic toxin-type HINT domain-containing protein [Mycolicibacterium mucogenicum]
MADGSKRPIAELKAGDRVWSVAPETGHRSSELVEAVLVDHDTDLLDLTITNPADVSSVVHTTAKHPFYSTGRAPSEVSGLAATTGAPSRPAAEWVDAKDLRSGDRLTTPFHDSVAHVAGSTPVFGSADMWDLTVANTHAFFVATLTAAVLVHNCPAR